MNSAQEKHGTCSLYSVESFIYSWSKKTAVLETRIKRQATWHDSLLSLQGDGNNQSEIVRNIL